MEASPSHILLSSIILAAKLEEINYNPKQIYKKLNFGSKDFIRNEKKVLEALNFELDFVPVYSFIEHLIKDL